MATDQVKQTMNTFVGGMDTDTNDMQMNPNKYREAHNVRLNAFGEETGGTLTLIPGAEQVLESLVCNKLSDLKCTHDCTLWAGSIGDIGIIVSTVNKYDEVNKVYTLCWAVQKFNKNNPKDTFELVFGPCEHVIWNEEKNNLSVVTADESENVKKVYIATGIEKVMIINVCKKYESSDMDQVLVKNLITLNPPIFSGYTQGSIRTGMVQYCYRLSGKYGAQSQLSPCTKLIPIGNFEIQKQNNDSGKECCGVKIRITAKSDAFDRIQVYRIYQETFDSDSVVYQLEEQPFSGDIVFYDNGGVELPTTTLQSLYEQIDIIPKVIETKNNRLFAANIVKNKQESFKNWDSRAYQFNKNGECKMFVSDTGTSKTFTIDDIDAIDSEEYKNYCYNPYNKIDVAIDEDGGSMSEGYQRYMKDGDQWYHGGIGKNVKWKFVITEIDGTTDIAKPWFPFVNMRKETWPSSEKTHVFKSYSVKYNGEKGEEYDYDLSNHVNLVDYSGTNGTTYKDPMISYGLKTLRRDEVYRYGIVLYDESGIKYQTKWIADIRTPSIYTKGFHTFYQDDEKLKFYVLGIHFDITPPEGCSRYEIVRCNTTTKDISTITQCILQRPISNGAAPNDYFSSGIYTTANISRSAVDQVVEPRYYCSQSTTGVVIPAADSFSDIKKRGQGETLRLNFKTWTHNENAAPEHLCSDNESNNTLYCAASPEIAYFSGSFTDTYNAKDNTLRIDTLQYIYGIGDPEYNKLDAVRNKHRHSVGHAKVTTVNTDYGITDYSTYDNYEDYENLYKGDLFFPFGLQSRAVGGGNERYALRESSLLNGGAHFGFRITKGCIPWASGEGITLCHDTENASDVDYYINIKSSSTTLRRYQQSLKIQNKTINYNPGTAILSFILGPGTEGAGGRNTYPYINRELVLKACQRYIACSYAYNKLINWANKVDIVDEKGNKTEGCVAQNSYSIKDIKSSKIFDYNNAVEAKEAYEPIGERRYCNYAIGSLGNRVFPTDDGENKLWTHPGFRHAVMSDKSDAAGLIRYGMAMITLPCNIYTLVGNPYVGPYTSENPLYAYGHLQYVWNDYSSKKDREMYWRTLRNDIAGPSGTCVWIELSGDLGRQGAHDYSQIAHTSSASLHDTSGMYNFHQYENILDDSNVLKRFGNYKDHKYASIQGTYLANIKKNTTPYNGSSVTSIETSIYCSYGDVVDIKDGNTSITVFDGNSYIMPFEYTSLYKGSALPDPYSKSMFHISYMVPVETNMNLYLANGFNLSENIYKDLESYVNEQTSNEINIELDEHFNVYKNTFMQNVASKIHDEEVSGLYDFTQDLNNYTYNSIYSSDKSNGFIYAEDLQNEHISEWCRCYYSQPKERLESVDSYLLFRAADYLDADEKYGEITAMKNFKGQMLFWQNTAMGLMSVQERVQVADENGGSLSLGTGGVLERYDYLSNYYGMRKNDNAICASPSMVYWWDSNKKRIFQYQSGQNVDLLLTNKVDNMFVNSTIKDRPVISYDTKTNEVLFDVIEDTHGNLVYNERATTFTSIYDVTFDRAIQFDNIIYTLAGSSMYEWNKGNATFNNNELKPSVQFVVADNTYVNKVYDNHEIDMIVADSIENNNLQDIKFEYTTPLKQSASTTGEDMTMREKDYKMAIPRDNGASYGGRLRGKTMNVKITQDNNTLPFSLKYVITKYRQSLS